MKQILVNKSIAYAAKTGGGTISGINELNLLDTGAVAAFTEDNILITAGNVVTATSDKKYFYIAVGNQAAGSKTYVSSLIPRMLLDYRKQAYVAPVQLVKYIGYDGTTAGSALNLPFVTAVNADTFEADGKTKASAFIKIIDTTPGLRTMGTVFETEIASYEHIVKVGDTATIIIADFVAKINANPNTIVTAAAVTTPFGISLTAIGVGTTFSVALGGILVNATKEEPEGSTTASVGASVAMKFGEGTSAQLSALELTYSTERGNTNQIWIPQFYYNVPTNIVAGTTYDTYIFMWNGKRTTSLGGQETYRYEVLVALPVGSTQKSDWETIMVTLVGLFENSETGS